MPNFKKAIRMGFAPIFGSVDSPVGLGYDLSGLGSPVLSPVFVERSSSNSKVFAPEIVLDKSSTAASLLSCSSGGFSSSTLPSAELAVSEVVVS
jgi:hypothetical protein